MQRQMLIKSCTVIQTYSLYRMYIQLPYIDLYVPHSFHIPFPHSQNVGIHFCSLLKQSQWKSNFNYAFSGSHTILAKMRTELFFYYFLRDFHSNTAKGIPSTRLLLLLLCCLCPEGNFHLWNSFCTCCCFSPVRQKYFRVRLFNLLLPPVQLKICQESDILQLNLRICISYHILDVTINGFHWW